MIEWMRRVPPDRTFLRAGDSTWSYGETLAEIERREAPTLSNPSLTPSSIFDLLAGLSVGGLIVKPPGGWIGSKTSARLIVYTSGSTGPPKGVRLTMENLEAAASASAAHLGHDETDDWLLAMPLHHVGGLSILVRQVYAGGSVTVLPGFDPRGFAAAMRDDVTMVSVVPTMLRRLLPYGPFDGLRAVLVGGGPIPRGLLEEAAGRGLPVLPTYGMTETFGQVATLRPGSPLDYKAHPLPGVDLRIEDDGRIAIRGNQVSPGYLGELDRVDPWFVTNDLGAIDDDGALRVLGRADALIVTGGENVDPEAVEAALREHEAVVDVCIVGIDDEEWGQIVVGVFEGAGDPESVLRWAGSRMSSHMVPKRLVAVERIPRTALGKPDRQEVARSVFGESD